MKRVFNSTITLSNEFVRDHQVHGQPLLPGLAYVDMIYQLAERSVGVDFRKCSLSDVSIARPLRVTAERPVDVAISFEENPIGWSIAIDAREKNGGSDGSIPKRYASAVLTRQNAIAFDERIDIPDLKERADREIDLEMVYAEARTRGLVHQGSIKARGVVYLNDTGCLVEVHVNNGERPNPARYLIHPALLDGSAMAATVFNRADNDDDHKKLYIPLHYQSFSCAEPLDKSCYSRLSLSSFWKANDIQKMDIDFFDGAGRQIASLKGITTKSVRDPDHIRSASSERSSRVVVPRAESVPAENQTDAVSIEKTLRRIYSSYLDVSPTQLDFDAGFFELGFESAQLLSLIKDTETAFQVSLSPTLLFEKNNLRELVEYIEQICKRETKAGLPQTGHSFKFSESEPFLRDHLVYGQPAVMGVTHPCLMVEAVGQPAALKNIEFTGGPITLRKGDTASIEVRLSKDTRTERISAHHHTGTSADPKLCCTAELDREASGHAARVDIEKILEQSVRLDRDRIQMFYATVKDFTIGPMLRVIESAYVYRDTTLVLKVDLRGKTTKGNVAAFSFDPLLLNACYYFLDSKARGPRDKIFIPMFIESMKVFRPMTETAYIVNSLRVEKPDYVAFDAMVFTEGGECIAEIRNASIKEVANPASLANASFAPAPEDPRRPGTALDIAIVGLSGKYPQAPDVGAFWTALRDGRDCIEEIPADRWNWRDYYSEDRTKPGCMYSKWGGFIKDIDGFDARFFGISPREAELIDPQERLFLEHCWMALEDAGYTRQKLQTIGAPDLPGNVGVYVGVMSDEYPLFAAEASARGTRFGVGSNTSSIATRVSFTCDLHGPSMAIDTMCSSSLTAIETAARALAEHRIDAALAGGVNLTLHPNKYLTLSQGQFISSKGRCESFGEGGEGYIPAEGVGALFLKRLADAERDGDHIYGVIKGAALNHGGRASGYTVPNPKSQSRVIARALKESGIHPATITYIEAHGTGTKLGDPVEIAGLSMAYGELTSEKQFCWIGSAKSNIGHCEAAAGIAGITKVLLQMQHRKIVPSLHSAVTNPHIRFEETPFIVNQVLRDWNRPVWNGTEQPLRAGISSFGAGGSNAHIILEEYRQSQKRLPQAAPDPETEFLIVLSAKKEDALRTIVRNLGMTVTRNLESAGDMIPLADLAYTLQTGREAMDCRLGMVVRSLPELAQKLKLFLENPADERIHFGGVRSHKEALELFGDDDDVRELLDTWLSKKKYSRILDFWVKGGTVDWVKVYHDRQPRRLSLPVYPFSHERYWLPLESRHSPEAVASPAVEKTNLSLATFQEIWREQALPLRRGAALRTIVCMLSRPEYQQIALARIQSVFPSCHAHFVSAEESLSMEQEFAQVRDKFGSIDAVLYLWTLDEKMYIRDMSPIVSVIHGLIAAKVKPRLFLLGGLFQDSLDRCYFDSCIGFDRSLRNVLPDTKVVLVHASADHDYDNAVPGFLAEVVAEISQADPVHVLYVDGRRHVYDVTSVSVGAGETKLRTGGTYLITGGCGHLGYLFASYLAKRYRANLILIGQSPLDAGKQKQVETLAGLGGTAIYLTADISAEDDVRSAIERAKSQFGPLHGVIHAAGRQPDPTLGKDVRRFQSVLAPKVQGTIALDNVLAAEPLEFVCYFSSSAAILGDFGSCDYAIGNRFQAAYARYRNGLRAQGSRDGVAIAVNWPIWKVGGIGFENGNQREMYLKTSGQRLLETEEGIEVFERLLASGQEQCLVLAGDERRMRRFLGIDRDLTHEEGPTVAVDQRVMEDIKQIVSDILKIPVMELDVAVSWIDFGFDSVTLTEFAAALSKHYRVEINPVQFYNHSTIEALVHHLLNEHRVTIHALYQESVPAPPNEVLPVSFAPVAPATPVTTTAEPIAIIGLSGRFPKSRSIDEMWQILANGQDAVEEVPAERFDWRTIYGNPLEDGSKTNGKWCGCIPGVDEFDPLFFEISPREAEAMDPRQRLLLMEAWKALEDAGMCGSQLRQSKVGMFVGTEAGEHAVWTGENAGITANHDAILAARLSYFLNLRGPNLAINTACSSGLVAAHLACQSLRNQECNVAIAAAVNVLLKPDAFVLMGQAGMLSNEGKCFTFDKRANGIVPGEAIVAVVLKRLSEAERDGDPIYAVIRGSGINYDGKTNGITAPSGISQSELMTEVFDRCRINPDEMDYVVTHGTGTQLGDPIEVNALLDTFKGHTTRTKYCALTSNKTNLGHTMAASGLVSLVNLVQAMRYELIPASLHCEAENDFIPWDKSPFFVNKANRSWPRNSTKPRIGAVSSFGMSGTNAHMLLQDYEVTPVERASVENRAVLLALSAKSREALARKVQDMIAWVGSDAAQRYSLEQLSYTLLAGRQHFVHRCAIVAQDRQEAEELWKSITFDTPAALGQFLIPEVQGLLDQIQSTKGDSTGYRETLNAVADHYRQGHDLDWEMLFSAPRPQRIHLPTYPFSTRSYRTKPSDEKPQQPVVITDPVARFNVEDYLIQLVAGHLKLPVDQVDFGKDLDEYGLDSIEATKLVHAMSKTFPELPQSLFLEYRTLDEVRGFLRQKFPKELETLAPASPAEAAQPENHPPLRQQTGNVSIVGMAGLFPGASSIRDFVENLRNRIVVTSPIPEHRRRLLGLRSLPGKDAVHGGYLDDVEYFDYQSFKMSLGEARAMDPQLRKLLEVISKAIADAGTTLRQFRESRTGLYVATKGNSGYQDIGISGVRGRMPSETPALYANRISNILNLLGPSEVVDAGCSSFLVAIKQAITALKAGRCDQAIVAAAELSLSPDNRQNDIGLYTSGAETRSFSNDSDGYVKSEVIGAIVLKVEEQAVQGGCPIYASIKGVGVCHGGKAPLKWYSPNIRGQKLAIEEALAESAIDPATVMYVEAEANGSQLGDASELNAIQSIYGKYLKTSEYSMGEDMRPKVRISSLKPLVGHAENASTFTALVGLIHSLQTRRMREVYGLRDINKGIMLEDEFEILKEEKPWPALRRNHEVIPRRAAVHSLAVGGVNAHLIIEEPLETHFPKHAIERSEFVFIFSEQSDEKLRLLIEEYGRYLETFEGQCSPQDLIRMEYTLQVGREEYPRRLAIVAGSVADLKNGLRAWLDGLPPTLSDNALAELAREWMSGKTVDWAAIRPPEPIQRLNLPATPYLKNLCWHETSPAAATVLLAPRWKTKHIIKSTGNSAVEYDRTIVFCNWPPERCAALSARLSSGSYCTTLDQFNGLPLDKRFIAYTTAVFERVKLGLQSCLQETSKICFMQVVLPDGLEDIHLRGILALLKTARKEHSRFIGQVVVLNPLLPDETIAGRLEDNVLQPADALVRYVSEERQVQVWETIPETSFNRKSIWKDGGVYLITGGAGALGLKVGGTIARESRGATVILVGRSAVSAKVRKAADELHALGVRVIYEQADVSDPAQVRALVASTIQDCGTLTGIVHCAGTVDDKSILKKTVPEVERVLQPKVSGLYNLDEATKTLPLDCFILFSSASAVFGNPGQADYAAGNGFMNAFSVLRNHWVETGQRKGRTISISWPLWADGGMSISAETKALFEDKYSLIPLPVEEGLRAMATSAASNCSEVCVLHGDVGKVLESISEGRL